jgi:hypothetical protein
MVVVLANTIFTATIKHTHNEAIDQRNRNIYHKIEVEIKRFVIKIKFKEIFLEFIYIIF